MASCDPIASPSGLLWEVMTKRCRWRMASRMTATCLSFIRLWCIGFRLGGLVGFLGRDLLQQLFDAVLVSNTLVELEVHLGCSPQSETLPNLPPHEPGRALQRT